jgi:hypothetical protein
VRAADDAVHCATVALASLAFKVHDDSQIVTDPGGYGIKHNGPAAREPTASPIQRRPELAPTLVDATPGSHDCYVAARGPQPSKWFAIAAEERE